jgi:RimJ/RimL family protein N-acetyltransferase
VKGNRTVVLRPARKSDFSVLAGLRRDTALQHLLLAYPEGRPSSDADIRRWIARREQEPGGCFLAIADNRGRAVGFVQVNGVHRRGGFGMFGIALTRGARGKGRGREALAGLMDYARDMLHLNKLLLEVRADNAAAIALFKGAGFRRVGILRAHYDDGRSRHDVVLMERKLP